MNTDASKEEALRRMLKLESDQFRDTMNKLDWDILTIGHCAYKINDDGSIKYIDPLDPDVLDALNKNK